MNPEQYFKMQDLWNLERLKQYAQHNSVYIIESKRFPNKIYIGSAKDNMKRMNIWTNGCFDILHPGHLFSLAQAATSASNKAANVPSLSRTCPFAPSDLPSAGGPPRMEKPLLCSIAASFTERS